MEHIVTAILLFMTYSFFGWLMEVIDCSLTAKKLVNRGFLIGPACPIYGWGAIIITAVLRNYQENWLIVFVMAMVLSGTLEYFTSLIMEKIFHARWWDYSSRKYNINGRICLETMVPFGIMGLAIIYVLNPFFINIYSYIPQQAQNIIAVVTVVLMIIDTIVSLNVVSKMKGALKNLNSSTEDVTEKVKETLRVNWRGRRLVDAFPDLKLIRIKIKQVASDTVEKSKEIIEKGKKIANTEVEIKKKK